MEHNNQDLQHKNIFKRAFAKVKRFFTSSRMRLNETIAQKKVDIKKRIEEEKDDLHHKVISRAFFVEIKDRWFSTRKRILKTIGVFFIPFLYGFICIAAFWNPLGNIGTAPIAIASLDQKQLLVEDFDAPNILNQTSQTIVGIPYEWSADGTTWKPLIHDTFQDDFQNYNHLDTDGKHLGIQYIKTANEGILNYSHTIANPNTGTMLDGSNQWICLMDEFMKTWQSGNLLGDGLNFNENSNKFGIVNVGFPISNITYHNVNTDSNIPNWMHDDATALANFNSQDHTWNITNNNDYAQITIPNDLTSILINYLDASITQKVDPNIYLDNLKTMPINFYVTYEKSFLSAKLIDEMSNSLTSIATKSVPVMAASVFQNMIKIVSDKIGLLAYDSETSNTWTGGYSWKLPSTITSPVTISNLSFSDHGYQKTTSLAGVITENIATLSFSPGVLYTLPNEEYREKLKIAVQSTYPSLYDLLNAKALDGVAYLIPSIEGVTTISSTTNWNWNYVGNATTADEKNAANSLLNNIVKITKTLSSIPTISNAIATIINFTINTKIDDLFKSLGITDYKIFSINVNSTDVNKLLNNDQFLASFLSQDARYMFPDIRAPEIQFSGILPLPGNTINFGRIVAMMGCGNNSLDSIYKQLGIYGPFNIDKSYYHDDVQGLLDDLIQTNDFVSKCTYPNTKYDASSTNQLNGSILGNIALTSENIMKLAIASYGYLDMDNYVSFITIGSSLNFYGMGLGEYFVCIGLLVGTLAQIVVYDKKKRVKKIRARKWYLSKSFMMFCTSLIQSTILAVSICAFGWYAIGAAFILQWLFMMFASLVFVSVVQSIWFCFRERSFGLFVIMIFLVLNVACGWGTFPAFMQLPFFNWVSMFLPFTYMMHIQGAIIYGISTGTHVMFNSLYILQNVATLLIYPAIFIPLGLFMSKYRERELYYGSANAKRIANVCKQLGKTSWLKPNGKLNWKALPHDEIPEIKAKLIELYPYEKYIERFKSETLVRDVVDFDDN